MEKKKQKKSIWLDQTCRSTTTPKGIVWLGGNRNPETKPFTLYMHGWFPYTFSQISHLMLPSTHLTRCFHMEATDVASFTNQTIERHCIRCRSFYWSYKSRLYCYVTATSRGGTGRRGSCPSARAPTSDIEPLPPD